MGSEHIFESIFLLNEWWVGPLVGFSWIIWIICWHELTVLFKYLKVITFMTGKRVTVHGQSNEHIW